MANKTFTGAAGSGAIGTAGNWDSAALPSAGDNLYFNQTSYDLTGDLTGIGTMGNVYMTGGWKGKLIGTSSTPVKIKLASSKTWTISAGPNCELVHISAGASGNIPTLKAVGLRALSLSLAQTITHLECDQIGSLVVDTDVTVTNYYLSRLRALIQEIGAATGASSMRINSGSDVTVKRAMATGAAVRTDIEGGAVLRVLDPAALGDASSTAGAVDRGSVYVAPGGYLNWRSGQTAPTIFVSNGGKLNYQGAEKDVTIHSLRAWPESDVQRKAAGIVVTISNDLPMANQA